MEVAMGQIPRSTERISSSFYYFSSCSCLNVFFVFVLFFFFFFLFYSCLSSFPPAFAAVASFSLHLVTAVHHERWRKNGRTSTQSGRRSVLSAVAAAAANTLTYSAYEANQAEANATTETSRCQLTSSVGIAMPSTLTRRSTITPTATSPPDVRSVILFPPPPGCLTSPPHHAYSVEPYGNNIYSSHIQNTFGILSCQTHCA